MDACPDTDAILAFAEGQCDEASREQVAAHVDGCADCAALVREALAARETAVGERLSDTAGEPRLTRGTSIGRYILLDPVGRGGLGEVYAAYDPELDRRIAIKLLMPGHAADHGFERRLVREGRALAKVTHPNVVAVYDVGTLGERVFIAMELVHGVTLGAWLAAAPRTWQQIRDVMLGAAAGLHAAHLCGLVHRDFKPSNVIVERDVRAKVLDFGLASAALEPSGDALSLQASAAALSSAAADPRLTQTGAVLGTPAYMAPEQMVAAKVDARADQFSFCVTCYEALLGCRPFAGRTLSELHAAITRGVPAEPSGERRVPAWLRRAIVVGLALDPAQRYPSMAALAQALGADPRARRRPWLALAAATVVTAGGVAWAARAPVEAADAAADDSVTALANDARAAAAKSYFVYPPPDDPEYRTANRVLLQLEAMPEGAAAQQAGALRREFADTLVRLGDHFWDSEGGTPFALDYYAQALVFDPEATRARERAMMTPGELASLRRKADDLSFTAAELAAAEPLAVLAAPDDAERRRRLDALYQRDRAPSLSTTARLEGVLGEEVTQVVRRAATRPRRAAEPRVVTASQPAPSEPSEPAPTEPASAPKPSAPRYSTAAEYRQAGRAALQAGRFGEAESLLGRALQLDRKDAEAAHALAELHFERGATDRAIEFAKRAVAARPKDARHRLLLGDCLRKAGRTADAREQYESARTLGNATAEARLAKLDAAGGP